MAGEIDHQADSVAFRADELESALSGGDRALHTDGDLHAGRRNFERAYQLALAAGDVRATALAALGLAGSHWRRGPVLATLFAAILAGRKTTTTGLVAAFEHEREER